MAAIVTKLMTFNNAVAAAVSTVRILRDLYSLANL
jgi:hypothetical protein